VSDVAAAVFQAIVVGILIWINAEHHSASKPVEDMGWSVLAFGIANLYVDVIVMTVKGNR
jgi:hypothetical protein